MSLSSSHSDPRTVPRLSKHLSRLLHCFSISRVACHHGSPSFAEYITQPGWRAQHTSIAAKITQLECLATVLDPTAVLIGVLTSERVFLQVINPSLNRAQPCEVSNSSAHAASVVASARFLWPSLHSCLSLHLSFSLTFLSRSTVSMAGGLPPNSDVTFRSFNWLTSGGG